MAINPQQTYVHLAADGVATEVPGGNAFWSLPATEMQVFGRGWLVSEYVFDKDWPIWEMHPQADEFVYLLAGALDLLLDEPAGVRRLSLRSRGAIVVPRGVWHTAKVLAPSQVLHVTRGEGTQSRPL